ncbi:aminopeptidase [Derxia lacustris]|uniref:aminopeptidase n=1 Tax=Derxia lacustris TaxID=764842 RepID=UPI001F42A0C0|nr:aminopeptidase [Derxia lacustris]
MRLKRGAAARPERASHARPRRIALTLAATALLLGAGSGCSTLGYYAQSVAGQAELLQRARPIDEVIADPATDAKLRARLEQVQDIRRFAARELALPDNPSYTRYADLRRPFVVWNVFATQPLSLALETSCFPVVGCVGYRGYFAEADARAWAEPLRARGLDVNVAGIPAYSTLGWFADPVLSTFINLPEPELARMIFHELSHQVAYAANDTMFNESYATAVERAGVQRWLARRGDPALAASYAAYDGRRQDFLALIERQRERLAAIYASDADDASRLAAKRAAFAQLRADYDALKRERWGGFAGYDRFFAQDLNNAHIAAIAAYHQLVPAFERLLDEQHGDFARFHAEVRRLARLGPLGRAAAVARLCPDCQPAADTAAAPR